MKSRRKYDRYDDDDREERGSFTPPVKLTGADWLIAFVLGAVGAAASWALSFKGGLHPDAWADCAVAAGLRPASSICPGFWRVAARGLFKAFGVAGGCAAVSVLGKVALGFITAFAYLSFKNTLAVLVRLIGGDKSWSKKIARVIAAVATVLFLCSDPVWSLGRAFTPATLSALLLTLAVHLLLSFLSSGLVRPAYSAMFVVGLLCAETPLGLIFLAVFWLVFHVLLTHGSLFHVKLLAPLNRQSAKWYMTFFWATGLLAGAAVDVLGFVSFHGLAYTNLSMGQLPMKYATELWHAFSGAATAGGWIVGIGAAFLPFILAMVLLRKATDLEYFLSYHVGLVFFVVGCIAYSQMAALQPLWFWTLGRSIAVGSKLLLFICAFMSAATILASLAVVSVDAYCRDHRRLAAQFDPDLDEHSPASKSRSFFKNAVFAAVFAALVAGSAPGRVQPTEKAMLGVITDYVREIVTEAEGDDWIFTDGMCDAAVELESARRGGSLKCLSLAAAPGPETRYIMEAANMPDDEDKKSSEMGGGNLLRTWQQAKPERIEKSAMLFGMELWKVRAGLDYPPISGVLSRTVWPSDEAFERGIRHGYELIERILRVYVEGKGPDPAAGEYVNHLFLYVQAHLAKLAHLRAEVYGRTEEKAELALHEKNFADALDDHNEQRRRIIEGMAHMNDHMMRQMTPREGLNFALTKADFKLASYYAEPILDAAPDDPNANFGMGMHYYMNKQYGLAEKHLEACLRVNERQPAFWNNIAVIQMHLGRYEEARMSAERALELLPDSAEIKATMKQVEEEAKRRAEEAAAAKEAKEEGSNTNSTSTTEKTEEGKK